MLKKLTPWLLLGTSAVVLVVWASMPQKKLETDATLPESNKQQVIPGGYLYGSDQSLRELLTDVDIYFKNQGLASDKNSQVFEYAKEAGQLPESCVEFAYLKDGNWSVVFTLIPENAACFSQDMAVREKVENLRNQFRYIYAVTHATI